MSTFTDRHRSDFNFAGGVGSFGDILWRDQAGDDVVWLMNNNTPGSIAMLPFVPPDWHVKAAANFDSPHALGNEDSDILWQNDNGSLAFWQMEGTSVSAIGALPNPGPAWHVVGDNDFDADGVDDIFFQNDNGSVALWTITSASITSASAPTISGVFTGLLNPGPAWHVVGSGDTSGDEAAGVLWRNDNGALAIWENPAFVNQSFLGGTFTFTTVAALPTVDPSWHVKGMADVNGDLREDIVFQNDNGAVVIWEMGGAAGTTILNVNLVNPNPGPAWHIVGLRDMNQDAKADILFQNDNGAPAVWEDYTPLGSGMATFLAIPITPNPNPNGHVWDLL